MDKKRLKRAAISKKAYEEATWRLEFFCKDPKDTKVVFLTMLNDDERGVVSKISKDTHMPLEKVAEIYIGCDRRSSVTRKVIRELYS